MATALLRNFACATGGNTAIITALAGTVLIGASGTAIDYVRLHDENTAYSAAADAASLAGAALIRENPGWTESKLKKQSAAEALKSWKSNLTEEQNKLIKTPKITVSKVNDEWSVRVAFNGKLPTTLMGVVGFDSMKLEGEAIAAAGQIQTYWSFNFAIDTSSSMGIGATQADMDAMQADPAIGCMFACHYSQTNDDTVGRARIGGYKLRLDVVDEAVDNTIDIIAAKKGLNPKSALFGMTTGVTPLVAETDDLDTVKDHKIEVAYTPVSVGNTSYESGFGQLSSTLGKSGDGTSASSARKMVFIVTDGINDTIQAESNTAYYWSTDHHVGTIDPKFCDEMKANGVIVGVLYINYIVPGGYNDVLSGYGNKILPNMKSCASEGFFHDASDTKNLKKAFSDLLAKAFASEVRLTQ
jgi:hypothetical protein